MTTDYTLSCATASLRQFLRDEDGTAAMDNMVLMGSAVAWALAAAHDTLTAVADHSDDVALCMKRQSKVLQKDNWDYQKKLDKMAVRCGRI